MQVGGDMVARPTTPDRNDETWGGAMNGLEALQSVQFATVKGKRVADLSADDWEALIEWLETLEDAQTARQALAEVRAAGGDRKKAGWLEWNQAADGVP